jgi:hypothetical protein
MGCLFGVGGEEIATQCFIDSAMCNSMALFLFCGIIVFDALTRAYYLACG